MAKAPDLDDAAFRAMDKVCQLMYAKHREN
jgi:hypothetical protein